MNEARQIGEVAKEFEMEVPRLRQWCDKGLVSSSKKSNARWIPVSEFEKIKRIKEIFDDAAARKVRITFEDVKKELEKDQAFEIVKEEIVKKEQQEMFSNSFEHALKNIGMEEIFMVIAEKMKETVTKEDLEPVFTQLRNQQMTLLESKKEEREKLEHIESELKEVKGLLEKERNEREREHQQRLRTEDKLLSIESKMNTIVNSIPKETEKKKGLFGWFK